MNFEIVDTLPLVPTTSTSSLIPVYYTNIQMLVAFVYPTLELVYKILAIEEPEVPNQNSDAYYG